MAEDDSKGTPLERELLAALQAVSSTARTDLCWCDDSHNAAEFGHQGKCATARILVAAHAGSASGVSDPFRFVREVFTERGRCRWHDVEFVEMVPTRRGEFYCALCANEARMLENVRPASGVSASSGLTGALDSDAKIAARVRDILAERAADNTKEACDACEQCGPLVMCSYHSLLSELAMRVYVPPAARASSGSSEAQR